MDGLMSTQWLSLIPKLLLPVFGPLVAYNVYCGLRRQKRISSLKGKVVLITGASSGLGEALAHVLYELGCKVILASRRTDQLERVKRDLMDKRMDDAVEPTVLELDLEAVDSIPGKAVQALAIYGHIDVLINNGGISHRGTVAETDMAVYRRIMDVNLFGQIALTKALLSSMVERNSGHIVVISSAQGKLSIPFRSAYAMSKHAVQAFYDALRAEVSNTGIKINVTSPGYIRTNMSVNAVKSDGTQYGKMDTTTASGMDPREAAAAIVQSFANDDSELLLLPFHHKLAVLIRVVAPTVYFHFTGKRARSETLPA